MIKKLNSFLKTKGVSVGFIDVYPGRQSYMEITTNLNKKMTDSDRKSLANDIKSLYPLIGSVNTKYLESSLTIYFKSGTVSDIIMV